MCLRWEPILIFLNNVYMRIFCATVKAFSVVFSILPHAFIAHKIMESNSVKSNAFLALKVRQFQISKQIGIQFLGLLQICLYFCEI